MSSWQIVLVALAGWLNREQSKIIDYLKEENRVLREQVGTRRARFTNDQRRRLAAKGRALGRKPASRSQQCRHLNQVHKK